eukprot:10581423-Prorocentrum_lima.AAC.1
MLLAWLLLSHLVTLYAFLHLGGLQGRVVEADIDIAIASGQSVGLCENGCAERLVHQPLLAIASHDDHGPLLGQEGLP